jgi:6-methylsalicylate decarboxylase
MRLDIHQHLWTEPLLSALSRRRELPFIRSEHGLTVLYLAGERPFVLDLSAESPAQRARLAERDGLARALVCLSSPLGIESLARPEAQPLLDAYHEGALGLGEPFGVWGAVALDRPDPDDVDRALDRGCVGVCLPAGALADVTALARVGTLLARLEERNAPLFVHPGPGARRAQGAALGDPLWWPALTGYVQCMQASWLAFLARGRAAHPQLRVAFAMLAGLAPLHGERLASRGGPVEQIADPLVFLDTSSYGAAAIRAVAEVVGAEQLLYGSDRPVVEPAPLDLAAGPDALGFELASVAGWAARRLFGSCARSLDTPAARSSGRLELPADAAASRLDARRVLADADNATEPALR